MTAIAVVAGVVTGLGGFLGFLFYMVRWARTESNEVKENLGELRTQDSRIRGLEKAVADRDKTIETLTGDKKRLNAALAFAEADYQEILATLAAGGDGAGLGDRVNAALERLSKLSADPKASPSAPTEDH